MRCRHPSHNMPWSDEKLKQIIAQYTPVLHLHHKERYLPCSVEWYLERSQLWHVDALDEKVSACAHEMWRRLQQAVQNTSYACHIACVSCSPVKYAFVQSNAFLTVHCTS